MIKGAVYNNNLTIESAKNALVSSEQYKSFRDELLQNFYWKEDDYIIELNITYNNTKTQKYLYKFSIDANEAYNFMSNIDKSLQSLIDELYRVPTNLYYLQKDFSPDDT